MSQVLVFNISRDHVFLGNMLRVRLHTWLLLLYLATELLSEIIFLFVFACVTKTKKKINSDSNSVLDATIKYSPTQLSFGNCTNIIIMINTIV